MSQFQISNLTELDRTWFFPPSISSDKTLTLLELEEKISGIKSNPVREVDECLKFSDLFKSGPKVNIKEGCFYYAVLYQSKKCIIKTPPMQCLFGPWEYKVNYAKDAKYSLYTSLDDSNKDIKNFHTLLDCLDVFAFQHLNYLDQTTNERNKYKFHSSMRPNYKDPTKPLTFRMKIINQKESTNLYMSQLDKDYMVAQDLTSLKTKLLHGIWVQCVIEINPIWFSDFKFGITYRLLAVKICSIPSL